MLDLVTVMLGDGISGKELHANEIFSDFLNDEGPGENLGYDPLKDFVEIDCIADDRPDPLECLLALETGDCDAMRSMLCVPRYASGKSNRKIRWRFNKLADFEDRSSEANC